MSRLTLMPAWRFNPRAREGRDRFPLLPMLPPACFNPRAREGRDMTRVSSLRRRDVSIHAPVKGATILARSRAVRPLFQSTRP